MAISVQRGHVALVHPTVTATVSITPVPVGESFPIVTSRADIEDCDNVMIRGLLKTIVNDNYTELELTRGGDGGTCNVEWQVITSADFTVQSGTTTMSTTPQTAAITQVDLSKAFIVFSGSATERGFREAIPRVRFTSNEEVEITTYSEDSDTTITFYVVEWDGATVQSGLVTIPFHGDSVTDAIDEVDLSRAFLIHSFWGEADRIVGRLFPRGRLSGDEEVEFVIGIGQQSGLVYISYFVVEHDDIHVQSGTQLLDSTSETITLTESVELAESFIATNPFGNAYSAVSSSDRCLDRVMTSHKLFQDGDDTKLTLERGEGEEEDAHVAWFVVTYTHKEICTRDATNISAISVTLNGEYYDIEGDVYFEYREYDIGGAWTSTTAQTITGSGTFNETIALVPNTNYEFRAVWTTTSATPETQYGKTHTFQTLWLIGYEIRRAVDSGEWQTVQYIEDETLLTDTWDDEDLDEFQDYDYQVREWTATNISAWSNTYSVYVVWAPTPIAFIKIRHGEQSIKLPIAHPDDAAIVYNYLRVGISGGTMGIADLVDTNHPSASALRVNTPDGIKAWRIDVTE